MPSIGTAFSFIVLTAYSMMRHRFSGKILGGLKQKHKKRPFSDASASHLSLVLRHV